jgi:molybdopterin molybdotransferase
MLEHIKVADAQKIILEGTPPMPTEIISLDGAHGRVLRENVHARLSQPFCDLSAMDGYAVRFSDIAKFLEQGKDGIFKIYAIAVAGKNTGGSNDLKDRKDFDDGFAPAIRIFTGAKLPCGFDSIIIQEEVTVNSNIANGNEKKGTNGCITIKLSHLKTVKRGQYVRPSGMDFNKGHPILNEGKIINIRDLALLAAANIAWVKVARRPRAAILSSGDELFLPGMHDMGHDAPAQDGCENQPFLTTPASNAIALKNFCQLFNVDAYILPVAKDNKTDLKEISTHLRNVDFIISTGGASVGDYDLIRPILEEDGLNLLFHKIKMRPGKPVMFGHFNNIPFIGLPGNPVSAIVCAHIFIYPALMRLHGFAINDALNSLTYGEAILTSDLEKNAGREHYMRANFYEKKDAQGQRQKYVQPATNQDSALLSTLGATNCYIIRPIDDRARKANEMVKLLLFPDSISRY